MYKQVLLINSNDSNIEVRAFTDFSADIGSAITIEESKRGGIVIDSPAALLDLISRLEVAKNFIAWKV